MDQLAHGGAGNQLYSSQEAAEISALLSQNLATNSIDFYYVMWLALMHEFKVYL